MQWTNPPRLAPPPPASPDGVRVHTVTAPGTKGANLRSIAEIYYRDSSRWVDIYNANRKGVRRRDGSYGFLDNPETLLSGDRLLLP